MNSDMRSKNDDGISLGSKISNEKKTTRYTTKTSRNTKLTNKNDSRDN